MKDTGQKSTLSSIAFFDIIHLLLGRKAFVILSGIAASIFSVLLASTIGHNSEESELSVELVLNGTSKLQRTLQDYGIKPRTLNLKDRVTLVAMSSMTWQKYLSQNPHLSLEARQADKPEFSWDNSLDLNIAYLRFSGKADKPRKIQPIEYLNHIENEVFAEEVRNAQLAIEEDKSSIIRHIDIENSEWLASLKHQKRQLLAAEELARSMPKTASWINSEVLSSYIGRKNSAVGAQGVPLQLLLAVFGQKTLNKQIEHMDKLTKDEQSPKSASLQRKLARISNIDLTKTRGKIFKIVNPIQVVSVPEPLWRVAGIGFLGGCVMAIFGVLLFSPLVRQPIEQ
jgi:hypothetical protein